MTNDKICCFTGHREIPDTHILLMPEILDVIIKKMLSKGVRRFRAGGAVGFDTLAALKILDTKRKFPDLGIKLELILPCKDQTKGWSERDKQVYDFIFNLADSHDYAQETYTRGCMHKRNRMLVDGADFCVTYLSSQSGGTAYTCDYAQKKGVTVINVHDLL